MRRSRITTSGRTRGTRLSISSPFVASPTTLMSGAVSSARLMPSSIRRWSSAMATRRGDLVVRASGTSVMATVSLSAEMRASLSVAAPAYRDGPRTRTGRASPAARPAPSGRPGNRPIALDGVHDLPGRAALDEVLGRAPGEPRLDLLLLVAHGEHQHGHVGQPRLELE